MLTQEHLEAWTKLKKHLAEHQKTLHEIKGLSIEEEWKIDIILKDMDDCIDLLEEAFICSVG